MKTAVVASLSARTAPGSLIDQITQDALRRAVMAPTYMEALDITGAALLEVAYLAKVAGASHGR
jgi:hypothetical protein